MKYTLHIFGKSACCLICLGLTLLTACTEENLPPQCKIVQPANNSYYYIGDTIPISAEVSDPEAMITYVNFFTDGRNIDYIKEPPFETQWFTNDLEPGEYILNATVEDGFNERMNDAMKVVLYNNAPPEPSMLYSHNIGFAPFCLVLQDVSSNRPDLSTWYFSDDEQLVGAVVEKTFNEPGTYSVRLESKNRFGSSELVIEDIVTVEDNGNPCPGTPTVTDIDGNVYPTVQIGDQCWMKTNLRVTHFPNGDEIRKESQKYYWEKLAFGEMSLLYCNYENNPVLGYGYLYSLLAANADNWTRDNNDKQGICPDGWHLPQKSEWETLVETVEGISGSLGDVSEMLRSEYGWSENSPGNNVSGFNALPGGRRGFQGKFMNQSEGYWWFAHDVNYQYPSAEYSFTIPIRGEHFFVFSQRNYGLSVRCVKDSE
ncbi:MAG: hypothetical protein C0593_06995 [Marinilabiliales bacterium]|nr:MAG: hypothetical protein C0593_06995 [Marinilabiliales bacterium]